MNQPIIQAEVVGDTDMEDFLRTIGTHMKGSPVITLQASSTDREYQKSMTRLAAARANAQALSIEAQGKADAVIIEARGAAQSKEIDAVASAKATAMQGQAVADALRQISAVEGLPPVKAAALMAQLAFAKNGSKTTVFTGATSLQQPVTPVISAV